MGNLKGDLFERFNNPDTSQDQQSSTSSKEVIKQTSRFLGVAELAVSKDLTEDMPPLAMKLTKSALLLGVGDGLGGSGGIAIETSSGPQTEGRLASQALGEILRNRVSENPRLLIHENPAETALAISQQILKPTFSQLLEKYPNRGSSLKGSIVRNRFPTTLTLAIARYVRREDDLKINVQAFWAGDSPFFLITPTQTLTNYKRGFGDAAMSDDLSEANQRLSTFETDLDPDTPFFLLTATDFILKLRKPPLAGVKEFLPELLNASQYKLDFESRLKSAYQHYLATGAEGDDATLALYRHGNFSELPPLSW